MTGSEAKIAELATKIATDNVGTGQATKVPGSGASPFDQVLQGYQGGSDVMQTDMLKAFGVDPSDKVHPADKAISAEGLKIDFEAARTLEPVKNNAWESSLAEFNRQSLEMDQIIELVTMPGQKFSNFELLAIQAQLHAAAFKAELFVKIADATKTIPQTMINRYGGQ